MRLQYIKKSAQFHYPLSQIVSFCLHRYFLLIFQGFLARFNLGTVFEITQKVSFQILPRRQRWRSVISSCLLCGSEDVPIHHWRTLFLARYLSRFWRPSRLMYRIQFLERCGNRLLLFLTLPFTHLPSAWTTTITSLKFRSCSNGQSGKLINLLQTKLLCV